MAPRVLIADADSDTRLLYREMLSSAGCDVIEAVDGRDALAQAFSRGPSVVVTETRLPFIDGYALCELLRADSATRDVPILVLTADAHPAEHDRAERAGADAVLTKPVLPDAVLKTTKDLLKRSAALGNQAAATRARVAATLERAESLLTRAHDQHRALSKAHARFDTTHPPAPPPQLRCPSCDAPLTYQRSHVGGVSARHPEQWDYFVCPATCGSFQYRQRTRKLQQLE
jgi:CheY-like chemotaxis protein